MPQLFQFPNTHSYTDGHLISEIQIGYINQARLVFKKVNNKSFTSVLF